MLSEMKPTLSGKSYGCCMSCTIALRGPTRTGPDGKWTLCDACGRKYGKLRLPIYKGCNGKITAAGRPGANPIVHTGFARIGKKRDMKTPLIAESSQSGPGSIVGFCWRCKVTQSHGWRSGPDGARTLCKGCFDVYRNCKLILFQCRDGSISVMPKDGAKAVIMLGFQRTNPREHYTHPIVGPDPERDISDETENSVDVSLRRSVSSDCSEDSSAALPKAGNDASAREPSKSVRMRVSPTAKKITGKQYEVRLVKSPITPEYCFYEIVPVMTLQDAREGTGIMMGSTDLQAAECHTVLKASSAQEGFGSNSKCTPSTLFTPQNSGDVAIVQNLNGGHTGPRVVNGIPRAGRISVKAWYEDRGTKMTMRFAVEQGLTFEAFRDMAQEIFDVEGGVGLSYEDEEGDMVCLSSDIEMEEFFAVAGKPRGFFHESESEAPSK